MAVLPQVLPEALGVPLNIHLLAIAEELLELALLRTLLEITLELCTIELAELPTTIRVELLDFLLELELLVFELATMELAFSLELLATELSSLLSLDAMLSLDAILALDTPLTLDSAELRLLGAGSGAGLLSTVLLPPHAERIATLKIIGNSFKELIAKPHG
ncbi:MAG TPA: hypothetical protein VN030_12595 [Cellvibrio sp.]|nr:hypothetical protein [Cellvibrio sp.]